MPRQSYEKKFSAFTVHISAAEHDRFKHHCKRLGWSQVEIMRSALHQRLNELDEQEAFARANRAARSKAREAPRIGHVPLARAEEDGGPGLHLPDLPPGVSPIVREEPTEKIPKKFVESFPSWIYMVESAEGAGERTLRLEQIMKIMRERNGTEAQCEATMVLFMEKLDGRALMMQPPRVVKAPSGVPISGDLD